MLVQCSAVQCLLSTQCSAVLEVAAARARRWLWLGWSRSQASWVVLSLAAEWGATIPAHPPPVSCHRHYYAAATQQLGKWQIVQQISPEAAVTVININITKKWTQSLEQRSFCVVTGLLYTSYFNLYSENHCRRDGHTVALGNEKLRCCLFWYDARCTYLSLSTQFFKDQLHNGDRDCEESGLLRPLLPCHASRLYCFIEQLQWSCVRVLCGGGKVKLAEPLVLVQSQWPVQCCFRSSRNFIQRQRLNQ